MNKSSQPNESKSKRTEDHPECQYVAYCTEDGVCPYDIHDLMKKVRLQAIKDTLELTQVDNDDCSIVQIEDELN